MNRSGIIFLDGNIGRRMIGSKAFDPVFVLLIYCRVVEI